MPRMIENKSVATEKELLNFANKVRVAGGADILDALLPSKPGESEECLIARALNFKCTVGGWAPVRDGVKTRWPDKSLKWIMIPHRGSPEQCDELARDLAKQLKLRLVRTEDEMRERGYSYALLLPKIIGNAASAFDDGTAFTNFDMTKQQF